MLPFAAEPGTLVPGPAASETLKNRESSLKAGNERETSRQHPKCPPTPRAWTARGRIWPRRSKSRPRQCPPFYVPRIVLCSDGNATRGDALQAAASLRGKVEVLTVPLPGRTEPEVQLSAVGAPAQVLQGEPFNVEVVID